MNSKRGSASANTICNPHAVSTLPKAHATRVSVKAHKIVLSEYGGSVICYLGAAYLIYNFSSISDNVLQLFAVAIALLLALPVIALISLHALKSVDVATKTYIQAIADYEERKYRFQKLQRLNVSLGLFLLPVSQPCPCRHPRP